jgi:hypothetical protein
MGELNVVFLQHKGNLFRFCFQVIDAIGNVRRLVELYKKLLGIFESEFFQTIVDKIIRLAVVEAKVLCRFVLFGRECYPVRFPQAGAHHGVDQVGAFTVGHVKGQVDRFGYGCRRRDAVGEMELVET